MLTDKQKLELLASITTAAKELNEKLAELSAKMPDARNAMFDQGLYLGKDLYALVKLINGEGGIAYCIEMDTEEDI